MHRLNLVGCSHPDEQTIKWMPAVLLMVSYDDLPDPEIRKETLGVLKASIIADRKSYPTPQVKIFPEYPSDLPEEVFKHAYKEGAPVCRELPGIRSIGNSCIPLRKNSRLLKHKGNKKKSKRMSSSEDSDKVGWREVRSLVKSEMKAAGGQPADMHKSELPKNMGHMAQTLKR